MVSGPKGSTRLLLGGMAAAGVVAAHLLAYLFAVPDPHHRAQVLESTGHRDWSYVSALALGLLVAGLLRYIIGSFRGGRDLSAPYLSIAARLGALQLGGFLGIEALERLSVDHSAGLFSEPAILVGIVLQIVIALVGALVVVVLTRAIRSVLARRRQPDNTTSDERPLPAMAEIVRRSTVGTGAGTLRGPPLILHV